MPILLTTGRRGRVGWLISRPICLFAIFFSTIFLLKRYAIALYGYSFSPHFLQPFSNLSPAFFPLVSALFSRLSPHFRIFFHPHFRILFDIFSFLWLQLFGYVWAIHYFFLNFFLAGFHSLVFFAI